MKALRLLLICSAAAVLVAQANPNSLSSLTNKNRKISILSKFFDPLDDEFRVEDSLCLEDTLEIRFSVNPEQEFFIAYLDHSIAEPIEMKAIVGSRVYTVPVCGGVRPATEVGDDVLSDSTGFDEREEQSQVQYLLLKPSILRDGCEAMKLEDQIEGMAEPDGSCNVTIILKAIEPLPAEVAAKEKDASMAIGGLPVPRTNKTCGEARFTLTAVLGKMLKFSEPRRDATKMLRVKRFGLDIRNEDWNVLVEMTPEPKFSEMDLDLYLYHESDLFSYIFPNSDLINRNHHWNVPEYVFLSRTSSLSGNAKPKFKSGFYLAYVYAPVDSGHELNLFEIVAHSKYNLWMFYLMKMMSTTGFVFSMLFLTLVILWIIRNSRNNPAVVRPRKTRRGASSLELSKIPVCTICLEPYDPHSELKELNCGHHFHVDCVDSWLSINHLCPLCKQTPAAAVNMRRRDSRTKIYTSVSL
eukprot:TRINITY_DN5575_c0_g1_i2.p1 TRINITY_DN5575_c0_g1~~TRINITY_DN5575_c0_g1_i2.p1  ORF type:complete len:468 (-),score=89.24 TRINITY_DN5575_c0_g1_i2:24-1427(-)